MGLSEPTSASSACAVFSESSFQSRFDSPTLKPASSHAASAFHAERIWRYAEIASVYRTRCSLAGLNFGAVGPTFSGERISRTARGRNLQLTRCISEIVHWAFLLLISAQQINPCPHGKRPPRQRKRLRRRLIGRAGINSPVQNPLRRTSVHPSAKMRRRLAVKFRVAVDSGGARRLKLISPIGGENGFSTYPNEVLITDACNLRSNYP